MLMRDRIVGVADMRRKFGQIHKEYSPQARKFYCHFTAVTVSIPAAGELMLGLTSFAEHEGNVGGPGEQ